MCPEWSGHAVGARPNSNGPTTVMDESYFPHITAVPTADLNAGQFSCHFLKFKVLSTIRKIAPAIIYCTCESKLLYHA